MRYIMIFDKKRRLFAGSEEDAQREFAQLWEDSAIWYTARTAASAFRFIDEVKTIKYVLCVTDPEEGDSWINIELI
jgi:hypothetical protein